jgi:5'-nucleotidase
MSLNKHLVALCIVALAPLPSHALNILLTNDDGLTSNLRALQTALVAAGHDVLVSVPCQNQSGKGAAVSFLTPVTPLTKACRGNAAPAGSPGVGHINGLTDAHYVDGTPVMATMYGLDVLATARWGKAPDLVLSGPNEGQNLGDIVISSGTVSNAQFALARGLSAIAVSADVNTTDNDVLSAEVAQLTVQLLERLDRKAGRDAREGLLPAGIALNVNFPKFTAGNSSGLGWKVSRFGNFNSFDVRFVPDLGADPVAAAYGLGGYHYPGVSIVPHTVADATAQTDAHSEALLSLQGNVTITPMQGGYELPKLNGDAWGQRLKRLFEQDHGKRN